MNSWGRVWEFVAGVLGRVWVGFEGYWECLEVWGLGFLGGLGFI